VIVPDATFVRRLRTRVRASVKASPALRRERKRTKIGWRHRHSWLRALRFLGPVVVVVMVLTGVAPEKAGAVLVLWSALITINRAGQLAELLHAPGPLSVFYFFPTTNDAVFRHQVGLAVRSSLWLGADWLALGLAVAIRSSSSAAWCAAPLFAVAQWAVALAVAATLVRWRPRLPYGLFATVLYLLFFITVRTFDAPSAISNYAGQVLRAFERATPAGWLERAFTGAVQGDALGWCVPLGLGAAAGALLWWHWSARRLTFSLERIFNYDANAPADPAEPRWISADAAPDDYFPQTDEPLPPAEPTAPVDLAAFAGALSHVLDQPAGLALFRRGVLERVVTRLLTLRQRTLVDFLQPQGFGWSRGWLLALALIAGARLLHVVGFSGGWPVTLVFGSVGFFALPLFGGTWLGFNARDAIQARIGLNSFAPVGFWETARLLLTVAALRCLAALPLLLLAIRFGVEAAPLPWSESLGWAIRVLVAVLALQPLWVIVAFSKNSNDSSSRGWFTALLVLALLAGVLLVGAAGVALFALDGIRPALVAGAILLGYNYGALWFYGFAYNRGVFDLVALPPR
jgi:hypothetical protein